VQFAWLIRGMRTGVVTTRYPREPETLPEGFRGRPSLDPSCCQAGDGCDRCVQACLPGAITLIGHQNGQQSIRFSLNYGACIMCGLCVTACPGGAMTMSPDYELAARLPADLMYAANLSRGGTPHEPTERPSGPHDPN
jgi:hydrogenase-4 component H